MTQLATDTNDWLPLTASKLAMNGNVGMFGRQVGSPLKYLNYWMDCHEILYRHSGTAEDES